MPLQHRSPTRDEIDAPLVRRLIAAQFPQWADLPIRPIAPGGWDNRTFYLGETMTVRLPSAEWYSGQVAKEHYWLPRLAPWLPLPIPVPLAMGVPAVGYPWPWSIYQWQEGETATLERIDDPVAFARTLGQFLAALQRIDASEGPEPGQHNFWRGAPLTVYDAQTWAAIDALEGRIDTAAAADCWRCALAATFEGPPVWLHGDVAAGNLLVKDGRLSAVIDFGCSAVGDPACDMAILWTFFTGKSREAFISVLEVDQATLARGRGWALWKALIVYAEPAITNAMDGQAARQVIEVVLEDFRRAKR